MGRRGPKPTPTPLLKLRGSWRGAVRDEPTPVAELPECPAWASAGVREYWPQIGAMLDGLGIMARPHTIALMLLCDALADWVLWGEAIASAEPTANREAMFNQKDKAWNRLLKACREFGMTPSAITGVRSAKANDNKAKSKFPRLSSVG